jgi:hypothetical protein
MIRTEALDDLIVSGSQIDIRVHSEVPLDSRSDRADETIPPA